MSGEFNIIPWHENKLPKSKALIIFLSIICVFLVVFMIFLVIMHFSTKAYFRETDAVIVEIKTETETVYNSSEERWEEKTNHTVYVDYTVNDVNYEHVELGSYTIGMYEGQTIKISYDIRDPSKIRSTNLFLWLLIVPGFILIVVGILLINRIRNYKPEIIEVKKRLEHAEFLKREGEVQVATITMHTTEYNNMSKIGCMIQDGRDFDVDNIMLSEPFYQIESDLRGCLVDVYFNRNDERDYYVDLTSVRRM